VKTALEGELEIRKRWYVSEGQQLTDALERLKTVFRGTTGVELMDSDVAELAGLDEDNCRTLLDLLAATGAIDRPRGRVFVCRPASWWTSASIDS